MDENLLPLLLGAAFSISGVLLLRASWRARRAGAPRVSLRASAWLLIAVAFVPWAIARGADKGVTFAILVIMLTGAALVLRAGLRDSGNGRVRAEREPRMHGASRGGLPLFLRRAWVFLLSGPLSFAAALFLAAALYAAWDVESGSAANRLAAVILFVPLAWTLLAIYATYDVRLRYRTLTVGAFLLGGAAGTFLNATGVA